MEEIKVDGNLETEVEESKPRHSEELRNNSILRVNLNPPQSHRDSFKQNNMSLGP